MHTDTLTLPFFPGTASRPARAGVPGRRWLRAPSLPSLEDDRPGHSSSRRAEKRLSRRARRKQRIVLGTPELPYEPLVLGGAPLAALARFEGLAIEVTTRSSEILEQLELLAELDRRHAVTVDVLVASLEPGSTDLEERLRTVSALSAQGITTRLVLTDPPRPPLDRRAAARVRRLFEAARACRAFDVVARPARAGGGGWSRLIRHLRLELGFPRVVPGRG